jgi:hypothetical protein
MATMHNLLRTVRKGFMAIKIGRDVNAFVFVRDLVIPLGAILYIVCALLVAGGGKLSPFISSAVISPVYFLLPIGLGLLILCCGRIEGPRFLTRSQTVVTSYFVGVVTITSFFVARERYGFLKDQIVILFYLTVATSIFGYVRAWKLLRWNRQCQRAAILFVVVAVPLFLLRYAIRFSLFSEFPLTDLFQLSHILKGSMEYARSDLLNPFVADSYLPFQQVLMGLLIRFGQLDPIISVWFLPMPAEVLRFLVLYSVTGIFTSSNKAQTLALAACLAMTRDFNPTNGGLVALGTLLLLSVVFVKANRDMTIKTNLAIWGAIVIARVMGVCRNGVIL